MKRCLGGVCGDLVICFFKILKIIKSVTNYHFVLLKMGGWGQILSSVQMACFRI
jgi:hypothetical protein